MQAGRLRHRVSIQTPTESQGADGGVAPTWATTATVWAEVTDLVGREFFAARANQAEVTTRVRMRYRAATSPDQRLVFGSRTLEIRAVIDPDGRKREHVLMCREVT